MKKPYNLEERTQAFGIQIIKICTEIKPTIINRSIINQLIRSSTSIGANYMEANGAVSKKDFNNKIHLCKKETQETKHWLIMLKATNVNLNLDNEQQECQELIMIFQKISNTLRSK